jgi:hypothetical protein
MIKETMKREEKAGELIRECIQNLQQHPNIQRATYRSYLRAVYGDSLKRWGVTPDEVCGEWDRRASRFNLMTQKLASRTGWPPR